MPDGDWKNWPLAKDALAKGALRGSSLFIAAPTGTGKSTVATMLTIDYLKSQEPGYVSFYLVPLKALAEEVYLRFKRNLTAAGLGDKRIAIATGDYDDPVDFASTSLVVATYEKLNALLGNHASFSPYVVVADEFQIVGTKGRGPPIEEMTTLKFAGSKSLLFALSAVVSNAEQVARWLGIDYLVGNEGHRTVPLKIKGRESSDPPELVKRIVAEELKKDPGSQLLVFCSTVPKSEAQARALARTTGPFLNDSEKSKLAALSNRLLAIGQFNSDVADYCRSGVAFHNAGLTRETRREIESAFRDEYLKVITCTPTLAQGVNTPAKVVIVRDITRYSDSTGVSGDIPLGDLLNMVGRAGRPGHKHEEGLAYVVNASPELVHKLQEGKGEQLRSRLADNFSSIAKFVLQYVRSTQGATKESVMRDVRQTLWALQNGIGGQTSLRSVSILEYLRGQFGPEYESGRVQSAEMVYERGGPRVKAKVKSATSNKLYEVKIYQGGFNCTHKWYRPGTTCSHIKAAIAECLFGTLVHDSNVRNFIFLAAFEFQEKPSIPIQIAFAIDLLREWQFIEEEDNQLKATDAGESAAVSYLPIDRLHALWDDVKKLEASSSPKTTITTVYADINGVTKENVDVGKISSILEWMDEVPRMKVARYFNKFRFQNFVELNERVLYALETCDQFARIQGKLELQSSIRQLRRRIRFGVQQELLQLAVLNISGLTREASRALYNAGIRDLGDLRSADPQTLSKILGDKGRSLGLVAREMWTRLQDCISDPLKAKSFLSTYGINPDNAAILGIRWST